MSRNMTMLGTMLGHQDRARAGLIAGIRRLFVAGAADGAVINQAHGFRATAVAALLALTLVHPELAPCLSDGRPECGHNRIGGEAISLYVVTGALVKFGRGLGWFVRSCTSAGADVA
jgi:uncharacterized membrane protein YoaK (UPF0700 family)